MRVKLSILTVFAALVLVLTAFVGVRTLGPLRSLAAGIRRGVGSVIQPRVESVSEPVLMEARELLRLDTVEYVRKVVFPYDLYPEDFAWKEFLERIHAGEGDIEQPYLRLYTLAREVGIRLDRNPDRFIVFTVTAKAGYDLHELSGNDWICVQGGRATVALPRPRITELSVEDQPSGGYRYPTFAVAPDQWKRISELVVSEARGTLAAQGILSDAEQTAKSYLTELLRQSGLREVRFTRLGEGERPRHRSDCNLSSIASSGYSASE